MRISARRHARSPGTPILAALACCAGVMAPEAARADAVQAWNNTMLTIIAATSGQLIDGPPEVAREMAIVGTSMYNAALNATASGANVDAAINQAAYNSMMSMFSQPSAVGNPNTGNTDTIGAFFAANNAGLSAKLTAQINATFNSLGVPNGQAAQIGGDAANTVFLARTGSLTAPSDADGSYASLLSSLDPNNYAAGKPGFPLAPGADPLTGVGVYLPPSTTSNGHIAIVPTWDTVTPFITGSSQVAAIANSVGAPPDVTGPAYAKELVTTYCTGGVGTASISVGSPAGSGVCGTAGVIEGTLPAGVTVNTPIQTYGSAASTHPGLLGLDPLTTNALFWNDPGTTEQPPGHWLEITTQSIIKAGAALSELQAAELTALLGDSQANAAIAAWAVKYDYNLWRPITAITGNTAPGNNCQYPATATWNTTLSGYGFASCDAAWNSYIATPPHPDYVAGHPAFSGAAATILTDYFSMTVPSLLSEGFSDTSNSYCNGGGSTPVYGFDALLKPITSPISDPVTGVLNTVIIGCKVGNTIFDANNTGASLTTPGGIFVPGITESFDNFIDASQAATDSRVNGGIHTPSAINNALIIGDAIGDALFQAAVPEPTSILVLGAGLLGIGSVRRRLRRRR